MAGRWIDQLMEAVAGCWEWHALALHIGFQYREPEDADDCWEVWAYPAVQEIVGGQHDGDTGWSGFHIDLTAGARQEYVEDCPVCCRPHVLHVEVDEDGDVRVWAERE